MDEYKPGNIKLTHSIGPNAGHDDLLFLKQIGLRWVRLHYGDWDADVDKLSEIQKRFAQYGLRIYSAHHPAYRSLRIQLGQSGRDEDIELCCAFIRALGELGIPVTVYDFHPGNTYTTSHVERRGYIAREFDLDEFRNNVEKNRFEREYSAAARAERFVTEYTNSCLESVDNAYGELVDYLMFRYLHSCSDVAPPKLTGGSMPTVPALPSN
jgi:D-mannonate dehydratase